jgi:hypothetical protein
MTNGSLTLNGITDAQLDTVIRVKEQHEGALDFNPQQLQPIGNTQPYFPGRPGFPGQSMPGQPFPGQPFPGQPQPQPGQSLYNNLVLNWHSDDGLGAVLEVIHRIYPNGPVPPFGPLA